MQLMDSANEQTVTITASGSWTKNYEPNKLIFITSSVLLGTGEMAWRLLATQNGLINVYIECWLVKSMKNKYTVAKGLDLVCFYQITP